MDNLNLNNPTKEDADEPIPFDDSDTTEESISHSPLSLGRGVIGQQVTKDTAQKIVSDDRITGVKTFFTKLHPGAMVFLDEQISTWLKNNPSVKIRLTNTATGEVQGKKTEPSIIITVWY